MAYFRDLWGRVQGKRRVLVVDACHSGALGDLFTSDSDQAMFLSCRDYQLSYESEETRHGVFTKTILDVASGRELSARSLRKALLNLDPGYRVPQEALEKQYPKVLGVRGGDWMVFR